MSTTAAAACAHLDVNVDEAARLTHSGHALLLDVREACEWTSGHAPGAQHIPLGSLEAASLPRNRPIITACRSGKRSAQAVQLLADAGIDARNMDGGMKAWASAGLPVIRPDGTGGQIT